MKTEHTAAPAGPAFNSIKEIEANVKTRMEKAMGDLQHEMATIRTGRATLSLLDQYPCRLLRHALAPEPGGDPAHSRAEHDHHLAVGRLADRAHREGHPRVRPRAQSVNDGKMIRLPIPPLTEERRKEFVKRLHGVAEHHRVSVRNIRRDGNEHVKALLKDKKITEDDDKRALDEIQKLTNTYMDKIDQAAKVKEKEILEIK